MKVILRIEENPCGKEEFVFETHDTFVVGRSKINTHSQLKGDKYISRHHFILELNPPHCFLKDLGSTNGTKVNDRKLTQGELVELFVGDKINVGKTTLAIDIVQNKDCEDGTLLLIPEVTCSDCGKDVTHELIDKDPKELEGLIYVCKECVRKKEVLKEEAKIKSVPCNICGKDMKDMAKRDGKLDELRDIAVYICPNCKPQRDVNLTKSKLGDYELIKLLGKGGMGEVYKAWHTFTGKIVALKSILPLAAMDEKNHRLFQREMAVMSKLIHPNIVRFYDQGRLGREHYFATEFLNEGDASELITKKYLAPVPYREACDIIVQALAGLDYAHSQKYIHRDIKPQNILVHRDHNGLKAKLSDFGLAKNFQDAGGSLMTKEGEVAGTVIFMAPEQLLNYKYVKPPADVYSMGVTLYYLLTAKYHFNYPSPLDCILAFLQGVKIDMKKYVDPLLLVLSEPPIPLEKRNSTLPRALCNVVNKSIMKDENARYSTAGEFREDILKALG